MYVLHVYAHACTHVCPYLQHVQHVRIMYPYIKLEVYRSYIDIYAYIYSNIYRGVRM